MSNVRALYTILACTMILMGASCGILEQPGVKDPARALASYAHTGHEKACAACHEADRPKSLLGLEHGGGADCVDCHKPGSWEYTGSKFDHKPTPKKCATCHEEDRPSPTGGKEHGSGKDCVTCHEPSAWESENTKFSHNPLPATCSACHEASRYDGVVNQFDHAIAGSGDCVSCHKTPGTTWEWGEYTHANPTPPLCNGCHGGVRPTELVDNFSHALYGQGDCSFCHALSRNSWTGGTYGHSPTPSTCSDCHAAQRPIEVINEFDHEITGTGDCTSCHQQPGVTWADGNYEHTPPPASCSSCHVPSRPEGLVGGFAHATSGMGDCIHCHSRPGITWVGGTYSHNPTPSACTECHASDRPAVLINRFDHQIAGTGDCASCHTDPGGSWSGVAYTHTPSPTKCSGCHLVDRPAQLIGGFLHSKGGTGDCVSCHKRAGITWTGGTFNHSPTPTACADCHAADRPVGVVNRFDHAKGGMGDCVSCHKSPGDTWSGGSFTHAPAPTSCKGCHAVDQPSGIINDNFDHAKSGVTDCVTCHKQPGITWAGARYGHKPVPTACGRCHASQRPTTVVASFSHTLYGMSDCASCHKSPGVTWADGVFSHSPIPTTCADCHNGDKPSNHYTSGDCAKCHIAKSTTVISFAFKHRDLNSKMISTCIECHKSKGVKEHGSNVEDCNKCHVPPGFSGRKW